MAAALPFTVAAVEVDEIAALDALGAGQPPAGGVAQWAPLDCHVQPLRVVHGVYQVPSDGLGPAARSLRRPGSLPTGRRHDGLRAEPVTWDFVFNQVHPGRGGGAWEGPGEGPEARRESRETLARPRPASPTPRPPRAEGAMGFSDCSGAAVSEVGIMFRGASQPNRMSSEAQSRPGYTLTPPACARNSNTMP